MGLTSGTPHLLRAARGEIVNRPPVWMMRQAGRYMKAYRDLREKYPSFRQRSEIPEVAIEVSLQPWKAFQPDGVILFSDIVTPLPGIGIEMDVAEGKGDSCNYITRYSCSQHHFHDKKLSILVKFNGFNVHKGFTHCHNFSYLGELASFIVTT